MMRLQTRVILSQNNLQNRSRSNNTLLELLSQHLSLNIIMLHFMLPIMLWRPSTNCVVKNSVVCQKYSGTFFPRHGVLIIKIHPLTILTRGFKSTAHQPETIYCTCSVKRWLQGLAVTQTSSSQLWPVRLDHQSTTSNALIKHNTKCTDITLWSFTMFHCSITDKQICYKRPDW